MVQVYALKILLKYMIPQKMLPLFRIDGISSQIGLTISKQSDGNTVC
jgi:hypothetical protein